MRVIEARSSLGGMKRKKKRKRERERERRERRKGCRSERAMRLVFGFCEPFSDIAAT